MKNLNIKDKNKILDLILFKPNYSIRNSNIEDISPHSNSDYIKNTGNLNNVLQKHLSNNNKKLLNTITKQNTITKSDLDIKQKYYIINKTFILNIITI